MQKLTLSVSFSTLVAVVGFVGGPVGGLAAQNPQPAAGEPLDGLTAAQRQAFADGAVEFTRIWDNLDGLGPIFNKVGCANCHNNPIGGSGVTKVTRFGYDDGSGFDPLTALGGSLLQLGAIDPAAQETIPAAANITARRVTTSTLGLGLIEAIADADIAANESNPPGGVVSGRVHWVQPLEDPTGPLRAGRMGWKAQIATVLSFSADAAQNELGVTNRLLPTENAPNGNQALLAQYDNVPDPEDGPDANGLHAIDRLTHFQRYLAPPPQTPRAGTTGEAIFTSVGCADCHVAEWTTSADPSLEAALRGKVIRPYSDFLLHDMGLAADFIGDGQATGQELRTPSLWGVRTRDPLWHDGRIVGGTLHSRVLGPGGVIDQHAQFGSEARPAAQAFQALPHADRLAVVDFLDSLGRLEFDADGDGHRDQADLAGFRLAFGGGPYVPDDPEAVFDIDQDGFVDQVDLLAFALVYEPDCNANGTNDLADVVTGGHDDNNGNLIPDECEFCQVDLGFAGAGTLRLDICGDDLTTAGARASFQLIDGPSNAPVLVAIGIASNPYLITGTEYLVPLEPLAALVMQFSTDATGELHLPLQGGAGLPVSTWVFQAATFDGVRFDLSNALEVQVGGF